MRKASPIFILLVVCSFAFTASDSIESKVMRASEKNLSVWLAKIPVGQESSFGFSSRDEFASGKIGFPFHTITFSPEFYSDTKLSSDKNYIQLQNEWRVPVTVNGHNCAFLTVNQQDSVFTVNNIGATGLAKEVEKKTTPNAGSNFILRIYPLVMDILVHTNVDQTFAQGTCTPLNSALNAIPSLNSKPTFTLAEIENIVKAKLNQSKN